MKALAVALAIIVAYLAGLSQGINMTVDRAVAQVAQIKIMEMAHGKTHRGH